MDWNRTAPELGTCPTVKSIRRRTGLTHFKLAQVLGVSPQTVCIWAQQGKRHRLLWLLHMTYFAKDPINGWLRAAMGLPPDAEISTELAQTIHAKAPKHQQVAAYQRRVAKIKRRTSSSGVKSAKKSSGKSAAGASAAGSNPGSRGAGPDPEPGPEPGAGAGAGAD